MKAEPTFEGCSYSEVARTIAKELREEWADTYRRIPLEILQQAAEIASWKYAEEIREKRVAR